MSSMEKTAVIDPEKIPATLRKVVELVYRTYQSPSYKEEIEKAGSLFMGYEQEQDFSVEFLSESEKRNFATWFILDHIMESREMTPLEYFLDSQEADSLGDQVKSLLESLGQTHLGLYDLISSDVETGNVMLSDMFTRQAFSINEPALAGGEDSSMFYGLRMLKIEDSYYSSGDFYAYPLELLEHILYFLKNELTDPGYIVPPKISELLKKKGFLFNHMQIMVNEAVARRQAMENNAEEIEEAFEEKRPEPEAPKASYCKALYLVEDYDRIREILDHGVLVEAKPGDSGGYSWFKTPMSKKEGKEDGIIQLTKSKLYVETLGEENLDAAKGFVNKELKKLVSYMYDVMEKRRGFTS